MIILDTLRNTIDNPVIITKDNPTILSLTDEDLQEVKFNITQKDIDEYQRSLDIRRPIGQAVRHEDDDLIVYPALEAHFRHDKETKTFTARVTRLKIQQHVGAEFAFANSQPFHDTQFITREPVARYSKKRLIEFATPYVDVVNDEDWIKWAFRSDLALNSKENIHEQLHR